MSFCIHFVSSCYDRPFSYSGVQHEYGSKYRCGVVFVVINSVQLFRVVLDTQYTPSMFFRVIQHTVAL